MVDAVERTKWIGRDVDNLIVRSSKLLVVGSRACERVLVNGLGCGRGGGILAHIA